MILAVRSPSSWRAAITSGRAKNTTMPRSSPTPASTAPRHRRRLVLHQPDRRTTRSSTRVRRREDLQGLAPAAHARRWRACRRCRSPRRARARAHGEPGARRSTDRVGLAGRSRRRPPGRRGSVERRSSVDDLDPATRAAAQRGARSRPSRAAPRPGAPRQRVRGRSSSTATRRRPHRAPARRVRSAGPPSPGEAGAPPLLTVVGGLVPRSRSASRCRRTCATSRSSSCRPVARALFPGNFDGGAMARGAFGFARWSVARSERRAGRRRAVEGRDPTSSYDFVGRDRREIERRPRGRPTSPPACRR